MNQLVEVTRMVFSITAAEAGYHHHSELTALNEAELSKLHKTMRAKGYKHSSRRESALEHHTYTKGDRTITHTGWHGGGKGNRNYGSGKTAHTLYDSKNEGKDKKKPWSSQVHEAKDSLDIEGKHTKGGAHNRHVSTQYMENQKEYWRKTHEHVEKNA